MDTEERCERVGCRKPHEVTVESERDEIDPIHFCKECAAEKLDTFDDLYIP